MALTIPVSTEGKIWAESDLSQQREGTLGALRLETRVRVLQHAEERQSSPGNQLRVPGSSGS